MIITIADTNILLLNMVFRLQIPAAKQIERFTCSVLCFHHFLFHFVTSVLVSFCLGYYFLHISRWTVRGWVRDKDLWESNGEKATWHEGAQADGVKSHLVSAVAESFSFNSLSWWRNGSSRSPPQRLAPAQQDEMALSKHPDHALQQITSHHGEKKKKNE